MFVLFLYFSIFLVVKVGTDYKMSLNNPCLLVLTPMYKSPPLEYGQDWSLASNRIWQR